MDNRKDISLEQLKAVTGGVFEDSNLKAYINPVDCCGCGYCETECPNEAIYCDNAKDTYAVIQNLCIGCGACAEHCPTQCIILK